MTRSTEPAGATPVAQIVAEAAPPATERDLPRWRVRAAAAQEAALPSGSVAVSCPAPFGVGGLGRHLEEIVVALERGERLARYVCKGPAQANNSGESVAPAPRLASLMLPLTRFSPPWRMWAHLVEFDQFAASAMPAAEHLIAFNGAALRQFRRARAPRASVAARGSLGLVTATAHIRTVLRQHALAFDQYPIERSWAPRLLRRTLLEYEHADRIYVSSQRVMESFLAEGVREDRLAHFPLTPDARFDSPRCEPASSEFEIVYVGSLSVVKGVPLLVDAIAKLAHDDLRLVLVGGWETRGMRRFLERARARDRRIDVRLEDPLRALATARLYVHPSYDDGFGYAAAEAVAAGVPVIVTGDTGMKDLVDPRRNGAIVPSGDAPRLVEAIDAAYRGELSRA